MKPRQWIPVLTVIAIVFSCRHQPPDIPAGSGGTGGGGTGGSGGSSCTYTGICFESNVLPIFVSSCAQAGCHDATTHKEGYNLTTYAGIKQGIVAGNVNGSKLYQVIANGSMPPKGSTPLTQAQKDSIAKWINTGALNTTNCNCSCDTTKFTFAAVIQPLMQTACTGCHSGAVLSGSVDLGSYAGIKTVALNGKLMGSVTHASGYIAMPQGGTQLSACQLTQLDKWIKAGAQNN